MSIQSKPHTDNGVEFLLRRARILAYLLLLVAVASLAFWTYEEVTMQPYAPLGRYLDPQTVLNEDKTVEEGGVLMVRSVKCNLSDEAIVITGQSQWRQVDNGGWGATIPYRFGILPLSPNECLDRVFLNTLPKRVTPGEWILAGVDETVSGGEIQVQGWQTERFRVVERQN